MGAFYTNLTIRIEKLPELLSTLESRCGYISPVNDGFATLWDREFDKAEHSVVALAAKLSRQLLTVCFAVTVHDDDVLYFDLFKDGHQLDKYNSSPGYFDESEDSPSGGNAEVLCNIFGCSNSHEIEKVLRTNDLESDVGIFATERHRRLASLIGLPRFSVGSSFEDIAQDDLPCDLTRDQLTQIGNPGQKNG